VAASSLRALSRLAVVSQPLQHTLDSGDVGFIEFDLTKGIR
jgi:hypothetical protein